jgi:hypothetical protein
MRHREASLSHATLLQRKQCRGVRRQDLCRFQFDSQGSTSAYLFQFHVTLLGDFDGVG